MALCKNVETKFVPAGALLFRPGQVDNSIYVVKSGRLSVFIVEQVSTYVNYIFKMIIKLNTCTVGIISIIIKHMHVWKSARQTCCRL